MGNIYLAADSGGSKTVFLLVDEKGTVLTEVKTEGMGAVRAGVLPIRDIIKTAKEKIDIFGKPKAIFLSLGGPNTKENADYVINAITGPEVIGGSTRMKSGTAQKLVLNMFSTIAMIKLGRVTGNQMTYMKPSNKKLVKRARSIVAEVCKISYEQADRLLLKYDNDMQKAIEAFEKGE